jgi:hypothetical protein
MFEQLKMLTLTVLIFTSALYDKVAMGYSNATVRPSFRPSVRNILVNTLKSTSFNGF